MSDAFSDREKGFERKYQLDQEQQFRALARRDKLFGQWVAGHFGLSGAEAEKYAQEVVDSNFEKPGDEDMLAKVRADLAGKIGDAELIRKLHELELQAMQQIHSEKK